MSKTLGGSLFTYNCKSMDYCFVEAIQCLKDLCDQVSIVDCGSDDGTCDELAKLNFDNCGVLYLDKKDWVAQNGKEKLNFFTNLAKDQLITDYHISNQADEIIDPDSFPFIREAIETGAEGFLCRRHHLWNTPYQMLNVIQSRKPASTEIIRLAKLKYRSVGDAESLECQPFSLEYLDKIIFWHLGYVRNPEIMKRKVVFMQEQVFQMDHDKKLDLADSFRPLDYFNESDLIPIRKPLPHYVQAWAEARYPDVPKPTFK